MLIFIYGTLKNGCVNDGFLQKLEGQFLVPAETVEKYPMYMSKCMMEYFPYLENQPGKGDVIQGEIWDIPHQNIKELDYFEGVPDLYIRDKVKVEFENNIYDCFCYFKSQNSDDNCLKHLDLIDNWED